MSGHSFTGHAAECERADIAAPAELLGRIVPAVLVSIAGDGGIEPGEGPLIRVPGKRDHVSPVGEHLPHPVEGVDGVVGDDEEGAAVPDLAEFCRTEIHQIDVQDICTGFPACRATRRSSSATPARTFTETVTFSALRARIVAHNALMVF